MALTEKQSETRQVQTDRGILVLSPHRDDAAFSCGLLLLQLMDARASVRIANICTISDYAPYAELSDSADQIRHITRLRAEEDAAFVRHLKAISTHGDQHLDTLDLGWKDAPLRHDIATEEVLADRSPPAEEVTRLAAAFQSLAPAALVLAPLAFGGHIDHRLVRDAAIFTWPASKLILYEDLPYACRMSPTTRGEFTQRTLPWPCELAQMQPAQREEKRRMAICYGSQISPLVADEMEDYAASLGWTENLYGNKAALRALAAFVSDDQGTTAGAREDA